MRHVLACLLVACTAPAALAAGRPPPVVTATLADPFALCTELEKNIPSTLHNLRRLGTLERESAAPDTDHCADDFGQCEVRTLQFPGLNLRVLVRKNTQHASVLLARISRPRWGMLGSVSVGEDLPDLEAYFGVELPRGSSPVDIVGECTPLRVWHKKGRVTELQLDCQACN